MSGKKPLFLTGANAKIKVNGVTLAYAVDLSYSIRVEHATPTVLGMYEASSVEPISYSVTGTFTVVRYVAEMHEKTGGNAGTSKKGNGAGTWGGDAGLLKTTGRAYESFVPSKLSTSSSFSIEIFQKYNGGSMPVAKIRDARITASDFQIDKKSTAMQRFSFTALYADEDSFIADFSGDGQQFS
jgi:hypothetical protein